MKAEEIFEASVKMMKQFVSPAGMIASIGRLKERAEEENLNLLARERENINEVVRKLAEGGDKDVLKSVPLELIDALVLRYLKNRDVFMKTFPNGIEDINPDPLTVWAAIMISPQDDNPVSYS
ncbi:MAG: hypothetical protein OEW04_04615 [Nitrospirota bacterium]|nr:hypothetical protein [Nitrospirota bacterium]